MAYDVDEWLFESIKQQAAKKLLSRDHFLLDWTLIEVCASLKSFKLKDRDDDSDDGLHSLRFRVSDSGSPRKHYNFNRLLALRARS